MCLCIYCWWQKLTAQVSWQMSICGLLRHSANSVYHWWWTVEVDSICPSFAGTYCKFCKFNFFFSKSCVLLTFFADWHPTAKKSNGQKGPTGLCSFAVGCTFINKCNTITWVHGFHSIQWLHALRCYKNLPGTHRPFLISCGARIFTGLISFNATIGW